MTILQQLQHKINNKTKPIGALGQLEHMAIQLGCIQHTLTPQVTKPHIVVFAADHGIAAHGVVNPYPQAVTAQMVLNFVQGGAAINVLCKHNHIALTVVDAGVNYDFDPALPIIHNKVAKGTQDYTQAHAMSQLQVTECLTKGAAIVQDIYHTGCNTIGFGEMGIGNTSSAALIMHHYTGLPLQACVGKGTGANATQLQAKLQALQAAAAYHKLTTPHTPHHIMERVGGYELVMMAGAYLKAYELGMAIVVDGFIATAALLLAIHTHEPTQPISAHSALLANCIYAHTSNEQGHTQMLEYISAIPLLQLGMRLGEGTGAALAIPLLFNACAILEHMASFDSAGVSQASA